MDSREKDFSWDTQLVTIKNNELMKKRTEWLIFSGWKLNLPLQDFY